MIVAGGAGSNDAKIFVTDENGYKPCATITDFSRAVFTTDFNNAGDMLAIGGGDGVVRCFNIIQNMD